MLGMPVHAQRVVDQLDRGTVAVKTTKGVFVSWRMQSEEYYGATYNLYRDGTMIAEGLTTSNYTDADGTTSNTYEVAAVMHGSEMTHSTAVTPWENNYLDITINHPDGLTSTYIPNDACCADVDGDGQVEILLKLTNQEEANALYPVNGNNGEYTLLEVLELDGTVLWWVNCGPNMGDFQNNEQNIVGYDWDMDGKAEVVMRLEEGSVVHMADGTTYEIGADGQNGTSWTNYRVPKGESSTEWFTYYGNEFLFYAEGTTGKPYQVIDYPCARYESGETSLSSAWGDGYGHRASKFFFGAPYLDGRKPSIFLGRGIYTRHKFVALDVDPDTHELTERWRWMNNQAGSPWYGQGYHNYAIADVDMDGRDEIIWGSMVIDDNGKGLSTSGLGHGDAQHHGDLDPYTFGLEGFFCNESNPANNYRDLTTSKIYHRYAGGSDDGRAIAGNFSADLPGAMGFSAHEDAISCVTGNVESLLSKTGVGMNFRCYWDGDLLEETFNGGDNTVGSIYKYGRSSALEELTGSLTNNSTKATPSYMGDILGDWREEFIMRTADNNLRIFTTTYQTLYRNYSLWYDHQYRNGMVWEPCGYNQPPHVSYFLGELEGITQAPPSLGMTGKTEIANGGTINTTDETAIITTVETNDMTVNVSADGASPYIYIDNAPTWTQGSAPSEATASSYTITTTTYTHTLTGGAFTGNTQVIKQGSGVLVMPDVEQTYTGNTDVWEGTLRFNGTLANSPLWLNRHTTLETSGGTFAKGITADYNAQIKIGSEDVADSIIVDTLSLRFGSVVELDLYSDGVMADQINANMLEIQTKTWLNGGGPAYNTPVFRFVTHPAEGEESIADGVYCLGTIGEISGTLGNIVIEGLSNQKTTLSHEDGKLYITVINYQGTPMTWKGDKSTNWNLDEDVNFTEDESGEETTFVPGSTVTFDDSATSFTVNVDGNVAPSNIVFANTKAYTISGDSIVGEGNITKTGYGTVTINNVNHTGNTVISEGTVYVASLANSTGDDYGSLGSINKSITLQNNGALGINSSMTSGQSLIIGEGRISVASGQTLTQSGAIIGNGTSGTTLTKIGAGTLTLSSTTPSISKLVINTGTVNAGETSSAIMALPATVEFGGGALVDANGESSYSTNNANFVVPSGKTGSLTLDPRCNYTGTLTGAGTFTVIAGGIRNYLNGDWSDFEGEIVVGSTKRGSYDPSFDWNNSYGLPYATLNVPDGQTFNNNGKSVAIKALKNSSSVTGTLSGTGTYTLGENNDNNITVYNYINSPVVYKGKDGCEMRLPTTTFGRIQGTIAVQSGALRATGSSSNTTLVNGSNIITVTGTGKVYGSNAYFHGVQASNGGTFSITGTGDTPTTIKLNTGLTSINDGGILDMKIRSTSSYSTITAASYLRFNSGSTLVIRLDDNYSPAIGDEFQLWTASRLLGSEDNVTYELPDLPEGMAWDTSALFADTGVLKIIEDTSTAIGNIASDAVLTADVYTVDGKVIGRITTTKAQLTADVRSLTGKAGNYVVRFVKGTTTDNIVVTVK